MLRRFDAPYGSEHGHSNAGTLIEFLRVTTPSISNNMRTPVPPHFQPPPPPFESPSTDPLSTLATDEDDDSQYETPDRHTGNRISSSIRTGTTENRDERSALIAPENPQISNTMKNGNSYRHSPSLNIEEERHQLLKQNPQTGSYFIPHSCKFYSNGIYQAR
uniref:Uncharacterized protein n=1 Tax=Panagrolaimus sp. PS1159 TaxID=55785 RepID=A0AC35GCT4_9BILA